MVIAVACQWTHSLCTDCRWDGEGGGVCLPYTSNMRIRQRSKTCIQMDYNAEKWQLLWSTFSIVYTTLFHPVDFDEWMEWCLLHLLLLLCSTSTSTTLWPQWREHSTTTTRSLIMSAQWHELQTLLIVWWLANWSYEIHIDFIQSTSTTRVIKLKERSFAIVCFVI